MPGEHKESERAAPALPEVVNDTSELTDVPPEDESAKKHKDAKEQLDPRETESQPKDASRHQAKPLDGTLDDPPARPAAAAQVESSLRARCGRLAVRALALMSAPLDRRPRIVRRIIGWLAIWTGVIALAAIIAVLTRSAQPPESDQSGSALEGGAAGSAR